MSSVGCQDSRHVFVFHCNWKDQHRKCCGERVEIAYLTECAHVFCVSHAKQWFSSNIECPICRNGVPVRVIKVDFTQSEKRKNSILLGCEPSDVLIAADRALNFWASQKSSEFDNYSESEAQMQARELRMKGYYANRKEDVGKTIEALAEGRRRLDEQLQEALARRDGLRIECEHLQSKVGQVKRSCTSLTTVQNSRPPQGAQRFHSGGESLEVGGDAHRHTDAPSGFQLRRPAPNLGTSLSSSARRGLAFSGSITPGLFRPGISGRTRQRLL